MGSRQMSVPMAHLDRPQPQPRSAWGSSAPLSQPTLLWAPSPPSPGPGASSACPQAAVCMEGQWQVLCPPGAVLLPDCSPVHPEEEGSPMQAGPPSPCIQTSCWRQESLSERSPPQAAHPSPAHPSPAPAPAALLASPQQGLWPQAAAGILAHSCFLHWSRVMILKEPRPCCLWTPSRSQPQDRD